MSQVRLSDGIPFATHPAVGVRLMQLYRLRDEGLVSKPGVSRSACLDRSYLTRIANLPATLIPIRRATSEFDGSRTTTNPDQSSLRLLDLQLGHTGPLLIIRQFLHAFSVKPYAQPSSASPSTPPESTPTALRMAGVA